MRKPRVLFTLGVLELGALALSAFFWFVMRRDLLATYAGRAMPSATRLALSDAFVPATALAGALAMVVSWMPAWRTKTRTYLAGTALVCTVFGLAFAIWASYAPVFEQLGRAESRENVEDHSAQRASAKDV